MIITKKYIVSLLFVFVTCVTFAQIQATPPMRQVLSTTGGSGTLSIGSIDYTIGECIVSTYSTSSVSPQVRVITQGFQQPEGSEKDTTKVIPPFHIYTGITPNGDGENDKWLIDGIAKFPKNTVTLFNRWGDRIWRGIDYDNTTVVWEGKNEGGNLLPDATYFYTIEADGKTIKGWVELTR